jgi:sigma-B regulation protein RsbU (phosphoserine phosphatase)
LKQTGGPMYATAFYLMADVKIGTMRYAKAGHPNPLHLHRRADGIESLACAPGTQGPPLGMFNGARYGTTEGMLGAGDVVLFYTDGIHEVFASDEREFGDEGLRAAILKRRGLPLESMLNGVVSEAREFAGSDGFSDDVCIVGMELTHAG